MQIFVLILGMVLLPKGKFLFSYLFFNIFKPASSVIFNEMFSFLMLLQQVSLHLSKGLSILQMIVLFIVLLAIYFSNCFSECFRICPCIGSKRKFTCLYLCFISLCFEMLRMHTGPLWKLRSDNKRMPFQHSVCISQNSFICRWFKTG